jgi:hypothetical protein
LLFEDALNRVVGNYIRGQLTLAVIIGLAAGIGSWFLGLSGFALIIGVLAFIFETIPMVGPILAAIPAILISLLLPDPFPRTFWIIVYFVIVQLVETGSAYCRSRCWAAPGRLDSGLDCRRTVVWPLWGIVGNAARRGRLGRRCQPLPLSPW